jgi:hypothetical protein
VDGFAMLAASQAFSPPAGQKNRFNSFDCAASPHNQTKKKATSMLPEAKNCISRCDRITRITYPNSISFDGAALLHHQMNRNI